MIYYVGYYFANGNPQSRNGVLSAVNKMNYIIETVNSLGLDQTVVSTAMTKNNCFYKGFEEEIYEGVKLKYFATFGRKNLLTKLADNLFCKIQLIGYMIKHLKKDDIILAYHSPYYCKILKFLKKAKGVKLVLEVEELYSDVSGDSSLKKKEIAVCKEADGFIFPTELLSDAVNIKEKPFVTIHGTYGVEAKKSESFNDSKIHVVYAGTLDPRKGGAVAAAAAESLPANYHVHILGFGTEKELAYMKECIEKVAKKSVAKVSYDGLLSGDDYIKFIQSCDIGLSTQNPDAAFNATSFPSKILSYMANGLRVVSIKIPAIEGSAIGDYMYYYEKQAPEEIAKAIVSVDINDAYDGRKIISELNDKFIVSLDNLLKEI